MTDEERIAATEAALRSHVEEVGAWISGDGRVREDVAAELLDLAPATLANKRAEGTAPPHYRLGRVTYRLRDLAAYIEARRYE